MCTAEVTHCLPRSRRLPRRARLVPQRFSPRPDQVKHSTANGVLRSLLVLARAARHLCAGVTSVPAVQRIHPTQQFQRTWTIVTGTHVAESHRLTKLALETPGLTVVRVRPELGHDDASVVARVVVTSDAASSLDRVALSIQHTSELCVVFTTASVPPLGALVVEIELAYASLLDEIKATGGGDVLVVHGAVLARHADATVSLGALDRSRLFVSCDDDTTTITTDTGDLAVKHLRVASASGGSVFFSTSGTLRSRENLTCVVMGDGRVAVHARRVETQELVLSVVGDRGTVQIVAAAGGGVVALKAETVVVGTGSICVQASPSSPASPFSDTIVACDRMKVDIMGAGCVDVAAIAARKVDVRADAGARAIVQAHEALEMACDGHAMSVEYVGALPPRVEPSVASRPTEMLRVTPYEHRVGMDREPTPDVPMPLTLFTAPRVLAIQKAGVRETLRPLWTALSSQWSDASRASGTPAWVRVMEDVTGGGKSV